MSRNIFSTLIVVALAGLVAFGVARWKANAAAPSLDQMQSSDWLEKQLNLTPDQTAKLRALMNTYRDALEECCERHCVVRAELGASIFAADWSPEKQREFADRLYRSKLAGELATIEHMRAVYAMLDPAQQKKYEAIVEQCLCASCPHENHK